MALHKHIQSLHFPKNTWTLTEAKQWLEEHGYQEAEHAPSYVGTHSFLMPKPMSRGYPIQVFSSSAGKVFWAIVTEGAFPNPSKSASGPIKIREAINIYNKWVQTAPPLPAGMRYYLRWSEIPYHLGQTLPPSEIYDDGEPTGEYLDGTSVIDSELALEEDPYPHSGLLSALKTAYFGDLYVVVGAEEAEHGEDIGEVIVKNPEVIAQLAVRDSISRGKSRLNVDEQMDIASRRWHQILQYAHTLDDIKAIATRTGIVRLYHGCPSEFARSLVEHGPRIPYAVEDVARHVANVYGLTWVEFRPYALRRYEVVERLSTSTAPVAARWAWSFTLGEVLSDLNSQARMLIAIKQLTKDKGMKLEDAYEEVYDRAWKLAKSQGIRVTFDNAPDILGLPDKFALESKTGALVELMVDARGIPDHIVRSTQQELDLIQREEETEQEILSIWNHTYRDIEIASSSIKSARIVIDRMERWEQDVIEDMLKKGTLPGLDIDITPVFL